MFSTFPTGIPQQASLIQPQQPHFVLPLQTPELRYLSQITGCLNNINQLQSQPELKSIYFILAAIQQTTSRSLSTASSQSQLIRKESQAQLRNNVQQAIKLKYQIIKSRNQKLLVQLLNLRQKLSSQMYMHRVPSGPTQTHLEKMNEKIRYLKTRIVNKYNQLRFLKFNNSKEDSQIKQEVHGLSDLPLNELKKGVQLLQKQTIRLRQEVNIVIKYSSGQIMDRL